MPLPSYSEQIKTHLAGGPMPARPLGERLGVSQPTVSRALATLGEEVVRLGAARSIQYALRDALRGLPDIAVYRVDVQGQISVLGILVPVRPEGFVMRETGGGTLHSDGLPWWLYDMRPQGYLGRAYALRHGGQQGLPPRLADWSDTHALRALMAHGHDLVGNLLLGEQARNDFLAAPLPEPIALTDKPAVYARRAHEAAQGELPPGSSAGGEQPKFTAYADTPDGPRHVIVKFSEPEAGPVSERWRDLLQAEHLTLETLREAGVPAARTRLVDHAGQRFLEVERFDRVGERGRRGVLPLTALDAEFVGAGNTGWANITSRLAAQGQIQAEAARLAALLWAFGRLIGNTDMHNGNLSFITEQGRPYDLAPAYDMTPMAFAPRSGGGLPDTLRPADLHASVDNATWHRAAALARTFQRRLAQTRSWQPRFQPCIDALGQHLDRAEDSIARLA
ncbi:MAG: Toxin YjjJ [Paracidovorax wautersii]|uniref:Toxin YjjJ n=1 Tax=Paracidovorax wautersii TaxID=1177982 RepID=A0A7V8JPE3_9BURK|nr:MAG: Toxin YjjJ [Paracidovorax wautersii]